MFYPVLISFLFALFFAAMLPSVFKREGPGPWRGMLFFFLIIFFFSWAIGSWTEPFGPMIYGTTWLDYLIIAFIIMLVIGTLTPPARSRKFGTKDVHKHDVDEEAAALIGVSFGFFFWTLLLVLIGVGIYKLIA